MHMAMLLLATLQAAVFQPSCEEALELIREQEQKVHSASFKQQWTEMNITSDGQLGQPGNLWGRSEGVVCANEFVRMKYRFVDNTISRGNVPGFNISTHDCAVDGKEYRILEYMPRASETLPLRPISGTISGEMEDWVLESVCGVSCLSLVPAFYWGVGLSRYLEGLPRGTPVWQVLPSDSDSELRIWHPDPRFWTSENALGYVLSLDLEKNGLITSLESRAGTPGDELLNAGAFACVENLQLVEMDGLWLPSSCVYGYVYTNERTGERRWNAATQHTIEWSGISAPVAEVTLVLEFPPGLPVSTPLERKGEALYRFFEDNFQYMRYWAGSRGRGSGTMLVLVFFFLVAIVVVLVPVVVIRRWRARREAKTRD